MIKRNHIFRIALTIGLVPLVVGIMAIALVAQPHISSYVLAKMVEQASRATGGGWRLGISSFAGQACGSISITLCDMAPRPPSRAPSFAG